MKIFLIILLTFIQVTIGVAQVQNQPYTLSARIVEENTTMALPFVTVFNKQQLRGTATNLDGFFVLPNNQFGDTIVVAFLGYKDLVLTIQEDMPKEIILSPHASALNEIVITAESDFLYDLVSKARNNKKTKHKTSKTYLFLETLLYNEPIEIIEAYYNGQYAHYGTEALQLKKGRIGLKPINNRYYRSTESSKLFSMHDVFAQSKLFPESPVSVNKRNLKKDYTLQLNYTFTENQSKIYVVDVIPKLDRTDLFGGTVWIDQQNNRLIKISLRVKNAAVHPFLPIGHNTIKRVDMEINKTYEDIDGDPFINSMDFNYNIFYKDQQGEEVKATTRAFTKAYDYENQFQLPVFNFSKHLHEDYRDITAVPYDSMFWKRTTEFRFYDRLQEIENFITENKIENSVMHPESQRDSIHSQLQFAYVLWDEDRFKMGQAPESVIEKSLANFASERYHFNVKLYLDINFIQDSLYYQVYSLLDPVDTYYYFPIDSIDLAYMNMYFDLMEIQKRELAYEIDRLTFANEAYLEEMYQYHLNQFNEISTSFIDQTNRGKNMGKMREWNDYVFKSLGIDNLEQFGVKEER